MDQTGTAAAYDEHDKRIGQKDAKWPDLCSHLTETMQEDAASKLDTAFRSAITGTAGTK
jgi:hypothetical protein